MVETVRDARGRAAERFLEEVRGDDSDLANYLRIEERELERRAELGVPYRDREDVPVVVELRDGGPGVTVKP